MDLWTGGISGFCYFQVVALVLVVLVWASSRILELNVSIADQYYVTSYSHRKPPKFASPRPYFSKPIKD